MGIFGNSVRKNITLVLAETSLAIENIAIDAGHSLIEKSPTQPDAITAKGLFINNWFVGYNEVNYSTTTATSLEGLGSSERISQLRGKLTFFRKDGFITISNNLSYSNNVEFLGWPSPQWSGQVGPYAPVRNTVTYIQTKYSK